MDMFNRINWDTLWMTMVFAVAQRSIDKQTKCGTVLIGEDNHFISMGYNSFPRDCIDESLPRTRPEKYKIIIHSEVNAIANAVNRKELKGATAYITGYPCSNCFSVMLNAGIKKIIYGPSGSHCISQDDIRLRQMNISAKTLKMKIKIIKFEDIGNIEDIYDFLDVIKKYIEERIQKTDLING